MVRWIVLAAFVSASLYGEAYTEFETAIQAIKFLQQNVGSPFFLGCGFLKPHGPPTAPEKYFDLYDVKSIALPKSFAATPTVPDGFPKACLTPIGDLFVRRDAAENVANDSNVAEVRKRLAELVRAVANPTR